MDLNKLEEAFPGSRSLALSEQHAINPPGNKKGKNTMKPHKLIRFKTRTASPFGRGLRLIPALLACLALSSTQAVVPPPGGGYPGSNTALGTQALQNLTSGVWNTALGFQALFSDTTGSSNTATGVRALFNNNGANNTATGVLALGANTSGFNNTAVGWSALTTNSTGAHNTAVGVNALFRNTTASGNSAFGRDALFANTTGVSNNAFGRGALDSNTTGPFNNAHGNGALGDNTTGFGNNAFGDFALGNSTGGSNTAIGDLAGINLTTGNGNVCIGAGVIGVAAESNTTRIRNIGSTAQSSGIFVTVDAVGGTKLGFVSSSARYKEEIKPMDTDSESLFALKPVTFRYKADMDPMQARQYGLIAEEVAKVNPDLVITDPDGKPATLRFLSIQAMLLNEFLKEHRKVEELQATVAQQQKQMEVFMAQLKEQAAQIQKVSAQLQTSKPAPQVVVNTR
jgi:Chaperone of endosialidase